MKIIETLNITSEQQMPLSNISLEHLQNATMNMGAMLVDALGAMGMTGVVAVGGCTHSETTDPNNGDITWSVSAGVVYFEGKLYYFAGASGVKPSASTNVLVWSRQTTYLASDPVTFVNSNRLPVGNFNVHADRIMTLSLAAAGSGLANYDRYNHLYASGRVEAGKDTTYQRAFDWRINRPAKLAHISAGLLIAQSTNGEILNLLTDFQVPIQAPHSLNFVVVNSEFFGSNDKIMSLNINETTGLLRLGNIDGTPIWASGQGARIISFSITFPIK